MPGAAQAKDTGSQSVCQVTDSGSRTKPSFQFLHLAIWILGFLEMGFCLPAGSFYSQMPPQQAEVALAGGLRQLLGNAWLSLASRRSQKRFSAVCTTQDKKDSYQPVCNIPIITSLKEEERLIESSTKVLGTLRAAGRDGREPSLALTLSSLPARGEAAVQQK